MRTARFIAPTSLSTFPFVLYVDPVVNVVMTPRSKVQRRIDADVSSRERSQRMRGQAKISQACIDASQSWQNILHSSGWNHLREREVLDTNIASIFTNRCQTPKAIRMDTLTGPSGPGFRWDCSCNGSGGPRIRALVEDSPSSFTTSSSSRTSSGGI